MSDSAQRPKFAKGGHVAGDSTPLPALGGVDCVIPKARIEPFRPLLDRLPPGLADQIERAATAPEGEVLYAACSCDDGTHTFADYVQWRQSIERARSDRNDSPHPAHLIRRTTITEAVA